MEGTITNNKEAGIHQPLLNFKDTLVMNLTTNKKGDTYLCMWHNTSFRINRLLSASALLDALNGTALLVSISGRLSFVISFKDSCHKVWKLIITKRQGIVMLKVVDVTYDSEQEIETLQFKWIGNADDFIQSLENLVATSNVNTNAVLQKGFYDFPVGKTNGRYGNSR